MNRHLVLDKKEHFTFKSPFVMISISTPELSKYTVPVCNNLKEVFYSSFHDVDETGKLVGSIVPVDENNLFPFNENLAGNMLDFVWKWRKKVKFVAVHCDAGISRSPGIALALSEVFNGKTPELYVSSLVCGLDLYNKKVFSIILTEAFNKNMR